MGNVISIIMTIIRDHENSDRNAFPVDKAHLVFYIVTTFCMSVQSWCV